VSGGRPTVYDEKRVTTNVRFDPDLHRRLHEAANDRDVSVNLLVNRAVADYLDRLLPLDEITRTREPES
jgi:predicted transcriptional regulator